MSDTEMSLRCRYYESPTEDMEWPPHPHMPHQDPNTREWTYHERVSDGEVHQQFLIYRDLPKVRASREHREREFLSWERHHPPRTAREWLFSSYASYAPKPMLSASGRPLRHVARTTIPTYSNDPDDGQNAAGSRRSGRRATLATSSQRSVVGRPSRRTTNVSNDAAVEAGSDEAESDEHSDGDGEDDTLVCGLIPAEMLPPKDISFRINEPRLLQIWVPIDGSGGLGRLQAPFKVDFSSEDDIRRLNQWKDKALNRARARFGLQAEKHLRDISRTNAGKRTCGVPYTAAERGWVVARLRQEPDMSWPDIKNVFFPAFRGKYPRTSRTWDGFRMLVIKIRRNKEENDGADVGSKRGEEKKTLRRPRKIVEDSSDV